MLTFMGGLLGFLGSAVVIKLIGSMPFLGPLFQDTSGQGDIHLAVSASALAASSLLLMAVGLIAGMIPAFRASRLDPVLAMRSE